jgi:hypothetical protein
MLLASVHHWEDTGKGRQGAVLVRVDDAVEKAHESSDGGGDGSDGGTGVSSGGVSGSGGSSADHRLSGGTRATNSSARVPIVRTTTSYACPAQRFEPVHQRLADAIAWEISCTGKGGKGRYNSGANADSVAQVVATPAAPPAAEQPAVAQPAAAQPAAPAAPQAAVFNNALIENYTNEYRKMGLHSDQVLVLHTTAFLLHVRTCTPASLDSSLPPPFPHTQTYPHRHTHSDPSTGAGPAVRS